MRRQSFFLAIFLSMVMYQHITAQSMEGMHDDSLSIFLNQKNYINYFIRITDLSDTAYAHGDAPNLLAFGHLLRQDFQGLSLSEHKALRGAAMRVGHKIWKLTGNNSEALNVYLVAYENVENKNYLDSLSWYIENEISSFYTMKGDYDKAEFYSNLLETSLKHFKMYEFLSKHYANAGTLLLSQLKAEEAIITFQKGYHLADSIKYNSGKFLNGLNLAHVYNNNPDLGSAEAYLNILNELLPGIISDKRFLEKKSAFEIESAIYNSQIGNYAESIPLYKEAIETLSQYYPNTGRREFAKYYYSLATAFIHTDSLEAALETINHGMSSILPDFNEKAELPDFNQLYSENILRDLLELKAQVYVQQFHKNTDKGLLEKASKSLELALDVNDLKRDAIIADPSKLVSLMDNRNLISKGIETLYQLYTLENNVVDFDRVRTLFNRSKSLLYSDKTRRNHLSEMMSSADKGKWTSLQDTLVKLYEDKFDDKANLNFINGRILSTQEQINKIFESYNDSLLVTYAPEEYIEYFMSEKEIYSLSSINGKQRFLKLGSTEEFQTLQERFNEFILLKGMDPDDKVLNDMYRFLIGPVTHQLPGHIVIIPDGIIGFVPFEMLKDDDGKYLLEKSSISYSFEYLTFINKLSPYVKETVVYGLAPKYKTKEVKGMEVSRGSIYELPYAKMEIDSIVKLYGSSAFVSQSDSKVDLDQKLDSTRIFHYAGHAIIDHDHAYLALNDSGDEKQQLNAAEINLKHHPLDLVVLSACETGLGKVEQGEGIRSLGRSFMESGSKAIIISLWNVNDKSTASIMTEFYKYLKSGVSIDDALRRSKLDFLKNASPRYAHPYYWAAFIPAGDMNAIDNN